MSVNQWELGHAGVGSAQDILDSSRTWQRVFEKVIFLIPHLESLEVSHRKLKIDLLGFLGLILGIWSFGGVRALKVKEYMWYKPSDVDPSLSLEFGNQISHFFLFGLVEG